MRRMPAAAAAVLCAAVLGIAGCTKSGTTSAGGSASASPLVSSAAATNVTENTKQVCADAKKVTEDSTQKMTTELPKAMQSGADAVATVRSWFANWSAGMRTQAGRALDPELKGALTDLADGLDEFNANIKSVNDLSNVQNIDTPKFKAAGDKVEKICGP